MTRWSHKRLPTMNDVAELAGVSQTTVSFIINNVPNARISDDTRARVWAAIKELGYRPNAIAQVLKTSRSQFLGFITDEIATSPHAGEIVKGAQDVAWAHNKLLFLVNTGRNPEIEQEAVGVMLERQVEGIIYATMYHRPVTIPDAIREVPAVLLDCFLEDQSLPSVVPDEVRGGYNATEILINRGHRRIGFLNNEDPVPATSGRFEGYRRALEAHRIPVDETLICIAESEASGGYRCALSLMSQAARPSALFCYNDRMAMGAYDAIRKLNLRIPEDVAIIGFDNQEIIAAQLHPALSTMQLPHYEMGRWAVGYLLGQIDGVDVGDPIQQRLDCPFVERLSI